jgi:hypothetical protein
VQLINENLAVNFIDAYFFLKNPSFLIIIEKDFMNLSGLSEHVFAFDEVTEYQISVLKRLLARFGSLFVV